MEDLTHLDNQNNVLQLSKVFHKIGKTIEQQKKDCTKQESAIEELNFLKEQCVSSNVIVSSLASQTLFSLVENGVLSPANVLSIFITMLSNSNTSMKISAVGEGIINILLLDLKMAVKSNKNYACPFGLKTAQHPIITLMHKKSIDILDFANKLNGICNNSNELIKSNSIEFLRPVFLHAFCNPVPIAELESIWKVFLKQYRANPTSTETLLHEIFAWCRVTPQGCLRLSAQLTDVIHLFLETKNTDLTSDYKILLLALTHSLIEYGYNPKNFFNTIYTAIQQCSESIDDEVIDYMLVTMSQIIHIITPFHLESALKMVKILLKQQYNGNVIVRNMVLDILIIRLAINGKDIPARVTSDLEFLIKQLKEPRDSSNREGRCSGVRRVQYYHPRIAMNFNLVRLSTDLCSKSADPQVETLNRLIQCVKSNRQLAIEMHYFLRSIILGTESVSHELWLNILSQLMANAADDANISCNSIYFVLYLLAKEMDARKQMELLRGLTSFASVKENIPLILNTYRCLSSSSSPVLRTLAVDLHTHLWSSESRTYQFLHKILIAHDEHLSVADKWELNIAKASAIKEICTQKASQHGTDLVAPLSTILNNSKNNDLARSLALDAVILLCKSHTVNIVSTWKVLEDAFQSKLESRTTKSLCRFFGEVPLLRSSTNDYDLLFRKALDQQWHFIVNSDDVGVIRTALQALINFDFTQLTLQHMPAVYYETIRLPREFQMQIAASHSDPNSVPLTAADVVPYIPGECWIKLLQQVKPSALTAAIELVTHLIESEMVQYRSGVYMLAEGRPEPKELQHLHDRSPLRAFVKFTNDESAQKSDTETALKCLQTISHKYSRPIPPLNWFFLIEYINQGAHFENASAANQFEMKKLALTIAAHQIAHSGSAKMLVENYLQSFKASECDLHEIEMAFELVSTICDGISSRILANFVHSSLAFLYDLSASSHFEENCHFEIALESLIKVFKRKCLVPENIDIITDEILGFNDRLHIDNKIYDRYSTLVMELTSDSLERISQPSDHFEKALVLRTKAITMKKPSVSAPNTWMWLNAIIESICESTDASTDNHRKDLLLAKLSDLLVASSDEVALSQWIMYFLGKVQSNLTQDHAERLFSLDLFVFCIIVISGCASLVDNELITKNRLKWLNLFPEALWLVSQRTNWSDHMPRIFEFLYHLKTQQSNLPKEYKAIIGNTLICVKNNDYFLQKSIWCKFISL